MECSGHAAFKENRFLDDGAYLAVKLLGELAAQRAIQAQAQAKAQTTGKGPTLPLPLLSDLIRDLEEPVEYAEIRLRVKDGHDRSAAAERVLRAFGWVVSVNSLWQMERENWEGLRARVQEGQGRVGWLHVRPSLHDPVVSLTCESETGGGVAAMVRALLEGGVEEATADAVDWAEARRYLEQQQQEQQQQQQQQ
jgi:phosphomannomutase